MKKPQWIAAGIVVLLTIGLYALTQDKLFGYHPKAVPVQAAAPEAPGVALSIDSILHHAKESLDPSQLTRINFLENSITRGDVNTQKAHIYHQLAAFWRDTARLFEPYAWYTAESARLVNSENSLTFAARLFLDNLRRESNPALKSWKGAQAKDLFERSLKLNPANDSSQVGLGAVYLYGGFGRNPMEGIMLIRNVAEKDSLNIYAQETLAEASLVSGQVEKAIERYKRVVAIQPSNLNALLSLADIYERQGNKEEAARWYAKSLPHLPMPELKKDVEERIRTLGQ